MIAAANKFSGALRTVARATQQHPFWQYSAGDRAPGWEAEDLHPRPSSASHLLSDPGQISLLAQILTYKLLPLKTVEDAWHDICEIFAKRLSRSEVLLISRARASLRNIQEMGVEGEYKGLCIPDIWGHILVLPLSSISDTSWCCLWNSLSFGILRDGRGCRATRLKPAHNLVKNRVITMRLQAHSFIHMYLHT